MSEYIRELRLKHKKGKCSVFAKWSFDGVVEWLVRPSTSDWSRRYSPRGWRQGRSAPAVGAVGAVGARSACSALPCPAGRRRSRNVFSCVLDNGLLGACPSNHYYYVTSLHYRRNISSDSYYWYNLLFLQNMVDLVSKYKIINNIIIKSIVGHRWRWPRYGSELVCDFPPT